MEALSTWLAGPFHAIPKVFTPILFIFKPLNPILQEGYSTVLYFLKLVATYSLRFQILLVKTRFCSQGVDFVLILSKKLCWFLFTSHIHQLTHQSSPPAITINYQHYTNWLFSHQGWHDSKMASTTFFMRTMQFSILGARLLSTRLSKSWLWVNIQSVQGTNPMWR